VGRVPRLVVQVPRGGAVDRQLSAQAPADVAVDPAPTDDDGGLEVAGPGEIVMSVPSPETLAREAGEVRRVIGNAGTGSAPLVVEVEAAEELRDDELAAVVEAAGHTERPVILRVMRDG
jgi:hypothetical protein